MTQRATEPRDASGEARRRALAALFVLLGAACSAGAHVGPEPVAPTASADAPIMATEPGAWFDAGGGLTVVGAGRRLRLVLSAPVAACASAQRGAEDLNQVAAHASLPFHLLAEACRDAHPTILLPEEGETASPAELERSYHEVARCAAGDYALGEGWRPDVVASADPCPLALGLGWRLPSLQELSGLGQDDRKAIAGALFDTEVPGSFGSLLLYARGARGELTLASLSPNASDQPPALNPQKREQPLFGAALRCVRDTPGKPPPTPVLPNASACLREQRKARELLSSPGQPPPPDLQKLRGWLDTAEVQAGVLRNQKHLSDLTQLLASPTLERLAREAREERALTERYAELAEGLDEPNLPPAEQKRRRDEFDHLRRRLGGQIVDKAEGASVGRTHLGAVLTRLQVLVESAAAAERAQKRGPKLGYEPILTRLRELGAKASP